MPRNRYPLTKTCEICGSPFDVHNGAEFRNVTCSLLCGNEKATQTRKANGHWNAGNPRGIRGASHPRFGKHHTQEAKEQNCQKHLGKPSWNKGKIGVFSQSTRDKMSAAKRGQHISPHTEFKEGLIPWNKGRKFPQFSGANNPSWKGGLTPEWKKLRNGPEFRAWRIAVFSRDDWTCQKCLRRGVHLHPHHILNFSEHPSLRFVLSNGITLCVQCHNTFHEIHGRQHNSPAQLSAFLAPLGMKAVNKKLGTDFIQEYVEKAATS